jgi:hypothetical protein
LLSIPTVAHATTPLSPTAADMRGSIQPFADAVLRVVRKTEAVEEVSIARAARTRKIDFFSFE